jgi:Holliday junction resolvase RusA-like endonuclease
MTEVQQATSVYPEEIQAYERHVRGEYDYTIHIDPMPTPRPRSTIGWKSMFNLFGRTLTPAFVSMIKKQAFIHVYHPPEYTAYKEKLCWLLKDARLKLKKDVYTYLFVTFYIPYPDSTALRNRADRARHMKKPDYDNYIKGFQDALQDAGILLKDDGAFADAAIKKRYTTQKQGFISFNLI